MNRLFVHSLFACMLCLPAVAHARESWVIVKQNDFAGKDLYSVMTDKDFRTLDGELRKEGFMSTRARLMATRVWEKDDTREGRFPASMISARRAKKVGRSYRSQSDALDQLIKVNKQQRKKQIAEDRDARFRIKHRSDSRKSAARTRSGHSTNKRKHSTASHHAEKRLVEREKERDQAQILREEERGRGRELLQADVVAVYEQQIESIKSPPPKE